MNEFNFKSYDNSKQSISYCEVDKCKKVIELQAQLKAENDELKDLNTRLDNQRETYWKEYQKLKQTLANIKEIAEKHKATAHCDYLTDMDKILQKISECEVEE